MTKLDLSADEVLTTTRAVRKRLVLDRPVPREVLEECLEIALQAPSGSNAQSWRFLVVTDPDLRAAVAERYRAAFAVYEQMEGINAATVYQGDDPDRQETQQKVMSSAAHLAAELHRVPVLLIPCAPRAAVSGPPASAAAGYGSILPAVWSFMLAARERSLGTAWTTLHLFFEEEVAEILGIPHDDWAQVALIAVGWSDGTDFRPAAREPLDTVVSWDRWSA